MWKKLGEDERQKWKLSDEAAVLHKIQYPDYQYKLRRKTKKRTLEYLQLIIHTDDKNTSSTHAASPDPPNPPVSPSPSLCHDFNTIRTNDVQEIEDIELFEHHGNLSSCAIDIDNVHIYVYVTSEIFNKQDLNTFVFSTGLKSLKNKVVVQVIHMLYMKTQS